MVNTTLTDALANLAPTNANKGPACSVAAILTKLPAEARDALEAAMDREGITGAQIAQTLTDFGYPVRANTVARHRRAGSPTGCACPARTGAPA